MEPDRGPFLLHQTEERIGFRTLEFRPQDGLYLNGVKLLVKGTNRHCFESRTGRSVSKATDLHMQGDTAVLALKYDGAADTIVWKMTPDGRLGMDALVLNYRTDNQFRGSSWHAFPEGDISFLLDIPAVNSQGADGGSASVKMNKGDEGYHIRLWFDF